MSLLGGMVTLQTNYSSRVQAVEGGAEQIKQAFRTAKANAQSGKKDCLLCGAVGGVCGNGDAPLDGWKVVLDTVNQKYYLQGSCTVAGVPVIFSDGSAASSNFPVNAAFTTNSVTDVTFGSGDSVKKNGGSWPVTVTITANGVTPQTVTVSQNGEIL